MILITGATGNVGRALAGELVAAGRPVRALVREPGRVRFPPSVEVVKGDLNEPGTVAPALEGVEALFLLHDAAEDNGPLLKLAREAGVRRVVLVASLVARLRPESPIGQRIVAAEQAVRDSGLDWTILRPGQFAANTLAWAEQIRRTGTVRAPFAAIGLAAIHPADIAAVARVALTEGGHAGRVHHLSGPGAVTPPEQTAAIGKAIGRDLEFTELTRDEALAEMSGYMPAYVADAVLDLMGDATGGDDPAWHGTVEAVTGVPARTFQQWADDNSAAFA